LKDTTYIAFLSGGRDSTAMVELLLSQGKQVDYIIFTDTLHEFPMMYEYLQKFDAYLQNKYGKNITYLKPRKTFEYWVFGRITRGKHKGMIRGLPMVTQPCYWTREAKVRPVERFVKEKGFKNIVQYVGYTYSEVNRAQVKDKTQVFPLIENKMCEVYVDRLLENIDMINPLYEYFERTGCAFCVKQKERAFYVIFNKFPDVWDYMKNIENKLLLMDNVLNPTWGIKYTMRELEIKFKHNRKNLQLEAPTSCECKVPILNTQTVLDFDVV